jgi:PAS domain S-box-containing protein
MLEHLSKSHVQVCQEHAAEARAKAEVTEDPVLKAEFLDIERRWLDLAESFAASDDLGHFTPTRSALRGSVPDIDAGTDDARRLQEISTLLIQKDDLASFYDRLLDTAMGLMSSDMASMQSFNPERNNLRLLAWKGFHPQSAAFWEWVHLDSASTCGLALTAGSRVVVPDIETCDFMADTADLVEYRRSNIRAVQSTPLVSRSGQLLGMISTHWYKPHQPSESALRQLDVLGRQAADLIERSSTEDALRESEARSRWLASIVESSDDAIISTDFDGIITSWNGGAERIFGYTAEEAVRKPVTILIPQERRDEDRAILARIKCGERIDHFETIRQCKHGSLITVSLTVSPIKDAAGRIVGLSKIARDITEQKRNNEQIVTLAREAEHRTKNVLATVQATVSLSKSDTADGLKKAIEGRIKALANVHALFVQSRWIGAELSSLVTQELAPYFEGKQSRVRAQGPQVLLEPNSAQTIAMAIHELTSNAIKYGALSASKGFVEITWSLAPNRRLLLRWTERGGPRVTPPKREGFGTRVMERLIKGQMKGDIHLDWRTEGLSCLIAFRI